MKIGEVSKIYQEKGEVCLIGDDYVFSRAIRIVKMPNGRAGAYMKKKGQKEVKTAYSSSLVHDIMDDLSSRIVSRETYDKY